MADFGKILRAVGEFGRFQKLILFALCLPNLILVFQFASVFFIQLDPKRHCNTDWILSADPKLSPREQLELTVPREQDGSFSRCRMFAPVDWNISDIREHGLSDTTECQSGWVYQSFLYTSTIVTDFDMVCSRSFMVQVAQTTFMVGILSGSVLFGPLAESHGRRRAMQIPVLLMLVFTVAPALIRNLYVYFVAQFLIGIGYGGYRVNSVILATEWLGVSKRSWGTCVTQIFSALGQCSLAGLMYMVRDWKMIRIITAVPLAVVSIYIWFIPESARWLLNRGRIEEAKALLVKVAGYNKRPVPEALLSSIEVQERVEKRGIVTLFKSPVLRKNFFIIIFAWLSLNITYYSVSFNMANLGLNIFLTQFIFGLTELPIHFLCIWLLEVVGRRFSLVGTLLTGGLFCYMMLLFGKSLTVAFLATCGRFLANWSGSICNIYINELFPTSFRQTASGLGSISSRVGGSLAPAVNMMAAYHWSLPIVCYSSLTTLSGALCYLLPETRRRELPDSTEEAESLSGKPTVGRDSLPLLPVAPKDVFQTDEEMQGVQTEVEDGAKAMETVATPDNLLA